MKARPVKIISGKGYVACSVNEATHLTIVLPGPSGELTLPIILKGSRKRTNCWSWNGNINSPTLKPSVLTKGRKFRCHSFINDGKVRFLSDCSHEYAGKVRDLLNLDVPNDYEVMSHYVKCIGCEEEFEDLYLEDEGPDDQPVCDKCIEVMKES